MPTRIVWLTFLAAMDENGFCQFASAANVAHRARVSIEEADAALIILEGPDANSADPDHGGKRIEKVPGGWMILNAEKYRLLVTRAVVQEQTRQRVKKHREAHGKSACNAPVTVCNETVTPSEADTDTETEVFFKKEEKISLKKGNAFVPPTVEMCQREAVSLGMPESEGNTFHAYYAGIGWVKGKNQIPIKSWTSVMISWRDSWKQRPKNGQVKLNPTQRERDAAAGIIHPS